MSQTTLENWVTNSRKIKKIFYLNWNNKKALWVDNIPSDSCFITKVNWRQQNTHITICSNIVQKVYQIPIESYYQNMSYLKSHLQKCIRRKLNILATKTAYHMIKLDTTDFLRRLPIIMIEDVILHDSLPIIIWFMVATSCKKKFILQEEHIKWLLGVVNTLCNINEHDNIKLSDKIKDIIRYDKLDNEDHVSLLYSLQLRAGYGGMKCDIRMLNYFSDKWYKRFKKNELCNNEPITLLEIPTKLKKNEWLLEALDFHCAPYMIEQIHKKYDDISLEDIQKTIWHNSSKINIRDEHDSNGTLNNWNKIRDITREIQIYILNNYV